MRWFQAGTVIVSALAMTGCPSEFGREGRVAKAAHKDAQDQVVIERCADDYFKEVCGPGKWETPACLDCRNRM
jgi:hypothetical protein